MAMHLTPKSKPLCNEARCVLELADLNAYHHHGFDRSMYCRSRLLTWLLLQGQYQSSSFDFLAGSSTALPDLGPSAFCGGAPTAIYNFS